MHHDQPDWVLAQQRALGAKVRAARLYADLTQEELAERCGVSWRTIHRIEYATMDPTYSVLLRIAHELRIPLADLTQ
ncbi:helix-turn-helix domain-containing protein [Yinghuangia soli]|uniref:Helix-turn-helix domain-containing protein n=1 Tax=Yinghuangia soli TaxID=2908204 RepID=A0AA41Q6A7_9ACTN|nr:helix-turn-helix transcriptional regulator [Yinghuangia soli]MCF2531770.1 helix-turn-helix domain-containing protein [Yinghuangia soli]